MTKSHINLGGCTIKDDHIFSSTPLWIFASFFLRMIDLPSGKRLHNYGKIHHFSWENPLFLWPFSIAKTSMNYPKSPWLDGDSLSPVIVAIPSAPSATRAARKYANRLAEIAGAATGRCGRWGVTLWVCQNSYGIDAPKK